MRLLPALLLLSCASAVDGEDAALEFGPPQMGMGGGIPGEAGLPPVGSEAGVAMRFDAMVPGTCAPGTRLGICSVCGGGGAPIAAESDPECPQVDCTARDFYASRAVDDRLICEKQVHRTAPGGNCAGLGSCRAANAADACTPPSAVEVARTGEDCQAFTGCTGSEPPELAPAPPGTECPGGLCTEDGRCDDTVAERCADFVEAGQPCAAGVHETGGDYCEVYAEGESCTAICQQVGALCVRAWLGDANRCSRTEAVGCLQAGAFLTCRCTR